jgi:hypothetical protein
MLGKKGLIRAIEYTKSNFINNENFNKEIIKENVLDHCQKKLLKLKDNFIKTDEGKRMAKHLHEELENELKYIDKYL